MKTIPSLSEALSTHEATACSTPPTGRATRLTRRGFMASLAGPLLSQCAFKKNDVYLPVAPDKSLRKLLTRPALSISRPTGSGSSWILSDSDALADYDLDLSRAGSGQELVACLMAAPALFLGVMTYNATYKKPSEDERGQARDICQDRHNAADWVKHYQSGFKAAAAQHGATSVRIVPPRTSQTASPGFVDLYTYPDLAGTGVGAVIDLQLSCRFEGSRTLRPVLHTYCHVRRPGDARTLWETAFDTKSQEAHTLREWVKDGGTRFRATVQTLPQQAAQQLVASLYAR
ncbi:hypothetical protein [Prosthecobacter sp.]|uniref:hypothetical protein n=1 Tax=Prosthecobacter sp. TaxID=1965333 RepID=UPI0037847A6F